MTIDSEVDRLGEDVGYTVVARRYRPRSFEELIGQDHISQALGKAISSGRVGHAYLFTGARGVGKTSTARIFAKVLNTPQGTGDELVSEISQAIDSGDDIDVIEIDGASNRGIEEIRQLRANVNVRPSRSPYKIYIIDEVHMLTNQAFNALLKTLEEPPSHVKFIFCTTDPDKIPITVLSRCQRFDFAPVKFDAIQKRLEEICQGEGYQADSEALSLLARRAAGSMRDSQSLLEQVMSFSTDRITVEEVHALLGTADETRLLGLVEALLECNALQAIGLVDQAIRAGSDAGQLTEQLLSYLRDIMAVGVGGGPELLKIANPAGWDNIKRISERWGVQTVLSSIQILDESLVRMRTSVSSVTLLEVALVQICQLEQMASVAELLERVAQLPLAQPASNEKKNVSPNQPITPQSPAASPHPRPSTLTNAQASIQSHTDLPETNNAVTLAPDGSAEAQSKNGPETRTNTTSQSTPQPASESVPQNGSTAATLPSNPPSESTGQIPSNAGASSDSLKLWQTALRSLEGMLADFAGLACAVEPVSSNRWTIVFPQGSLAPREYCEQPERKNALQNMLKSALHREIQLTFRVIPGEAPKPTASVPQSTQRAQRLREVADDPYIKKLCEVIDGEIIRVDAPRNLAPPNSPSAGQRTA